MSAGPKPPNEKLRGARLKIPSPNRPGHPMSCAEHATAANRLLHERNILDQDVDATYLAKLEAGDYRWVRNPHRRWAIRAAVGLETDADIGFYQHRTSKKELHHAAPIIELTAPNTSIAPPDSGADGSSGKEVIQGTSSPSVRPGRVTTQVTRATESRFSSEGFNDPLLALSVQRAPIALGMSAPSLVLDDLERLDAVIRESHEHSDDDLVAYLEDRFAQCSVDDGLKGPRYALPETLGILSVVQRRARTSTQAARRPLLRAGAKTAEFAGWLYRDLGHPTAADYWRDRASEWAMEAAEFAMLGYVLVKKSQSAWDQRDAARMLGLTEAIQDGPWKLPAKIMAEAIQQQARGLAMLDASRSKVDDTLKRARDLHACSITESTPLAGHYDAKLFRLQTAICYGESGRADEAAEIYATTLEPG